MSSPAQHEQRGSVIWISGYSASGKTSVARRVEALLRAEGVTAIHLDGDDLRAILARRWGYTREERIDLARVYFRLCSHLSSQGCSVVISAVAMFDEVRSWLKENVPASVEVYLDVPEAVRLRRDGETKQVYGQLDREGPGYEEPTAPDLVVANHGEVSAEDAAEQIVEFVRRHRSSADVDHGRSAHWQAFYRQGDVPEGPSSFATAVAERVAPGRLLEVGCGNGRDALHFASLGFDVTALDVSSAAIERCVERPGAGDVAFLASDIQGVAEGSFDVIYSRFVLHAMTPPEERAFVDSASALLAPDGQLFVEARSIDDPLARRGEVLSTTERIDGHYRRFIVGAELRSTLGEAGLEIVDFEEGAGLARLGADDPVVIRVTARRPA